MDAHAPVGGSGVDDNDVGAATHPAAATRRVDATTVGEGAGTQEARRVAACCPDDGSLRLGLGGRASGQAGGRLCGFTCEAYETLGSLELLVLGAQPLELEAEILAGGLHDLRGDIRACGASERLLDGAADGRQRLSG